MNQEPMGDQSFVADHPAKNFAMLVAAELSAAREKHPGKQHSLHEGYAVLLEEVDEFWDEVKKKSSERSPSAILVELIQISAMAQRTAEDVVLGSTPDKIRFTYSTGGSLVTDRPIAGVTREITDEEAGYYGGRYFVCESMSESAARHIAEAFGGFMVKKL